MSVLWTSFNLEVNQAHKPGCQSYLWAITKYYSMNTGCKRSVLVQTGIDDVHPKWAERLQGTWGFTGLGALTHHWPPQGICYETSQVMVCNQGNTWWIVRIPEQLMQDKTARVFWYTNWCPTKIAPRDVWSVHCQSWCLDWQSPLSTTMSLHNQAAISLFFR